MLKITNNFDPTHAQSSPKGKHLMPICNLELYIRWFAIFFFQKNLLSLNVCKFSHEKYSIRKYRAISLKSRKNLWFSHDAKLYCTIHFVSLKNIEKSHQAWSNWSWNILIYIWSLLHCWHEISRTLGVIEKSGFDVRVQQEKVIRKVHSFSCVLKKVKKWR